MKRFCCYLLRLLQSIVIFFVILWSVLLAVIKLWGGMLNNYRTDIAYYLNHTVQLPLNFKQVVLTLWHGEPVIEFKEFRYGDKESLACKRLQLGIDLMGSILHRRLQLKLLNLSGISLSLGLTKEGMLQLPEVLNNELSKILSSDQNAATRQFWWERGDINLSDCEIKLQLPGEKLINGKNLSIRLSGAIGHLDSSLHGVITLFTKDKRPITTEISSKLKLFGSVTDLTRAKITGKIELQGGEFDLNSWLNKPATASTTSDSTGLSLIVPQGEIELQCSALRLTLPWLRGSFDPKRITTYFKWRKRGEGIKVEIGNFEYHDSWLSFVGHGELQQDRNESPQVNWQANYTLSNSRHVKRYYPAALMYPKALNWLDQAFPQSRALHGKMVLRGKLADFPFEQGNGEFKVITALNEVTLNYDNDWPQIKRIMGDLIFSGKAMNIFVKSGTILGSQIQSVHALIDDLAKPQLYIDGNLTALSPQGIKFIERSPLKETVGKFLMPLALKGKIKLALRFIMPLDDSFMDDVTKVTGTINFIDNEVLVKGLNLAAQKVNGTLEFSEDKVKARELKGKCYGRDLTIQIDPVNKDDFFGTKVTILGKLLPQLLKHFRAGDAYINALHGAADYRLIIAIPYADALPTTLRLTSDLYGFSSKLPGFLAKKAREKRELSVELAFPNLLSPSLKLALGKEVRIAAQLEQDAKHNTYQLSSGIISFNRPITDKPLAETLLIQGDLRSLNLTPWLKFLDLENGGNTALNHPKALTLDLTCDEFVAFDHLLNKLVLQGIYQNQQLNLKIKAQASSGEINYDFSKKPHLTANFSALSILLSDKDPKPVDFYRTLPFTLDFQADNLNYGKHHFDRLEVELNTTENAWQFSKFKMIIPHFVLEGEGSSQIKDVRVKSGFKGTLEVKDLGEWLEANKYSQLLRKTNGKINLSISWPGFITDFALANLNGSVNAELRDGRVVNLDKSTEQKLGVGKLLSILSLSSLSKLLTMNFQNLHHGFTFDSAKGNAKLYAGKLSLTKLLIDGTAAKIDLSGDMDLIGGDYNLKMKVVPNLTSSLPVAATILGGPIGGAIGVLADHLVRVVVKNANFYEYELRGNWNQKA